MNSIHPSFKHGKNFKIGKYCVIDEDVWVGDNVILRNFVELRKGTVIGNDVYIDSYVRSSGQNLINDGVVLRFGVTIARLVNIGDGTFIAPNVMTIHNADRGVTSIGKNCKIFTAAVIGGGINIVDNVIIGAQAFVTKDCMVEGTYIGIPARKI